MHNAVAYPLDGKIEQMLSDGQRPAAWQPTGLTKDFYLDLSEPIVRQLVVLQDNDGRIHDPFEQNDTIFLPFTTARFVGALGALVENGRCQDLTDNLTRGLDAICQEVAQPYEKHTCRVDFYPKEIIRGLSAMRDKTDKARMEKWRRQLGGYDPEKNYACVLSKSKAEDIYNVVTFAIAGEQMKKQLGISCNTPFIERHLETQKRRFTELGMYRDPNDPLTYDWTPRMNLSLLFAAGYKGKHASFFDEMLRRGGLTTLMYLSSTGEAPFGGRSNQQNFNEAIISVICEYEASRYKALGNEILAGAFKRAARLAALSVKRWLDLSPLRFTKNEFPPETQHGRERSYGLYAVYSLLIASQFGFAHLLADDTIKESPAPAEIGGYLLPLLKDFHKIFAACGGYHIEIDTRADHHYDATGLGRIHRKGAPTELGLSIPIAAHPNYIVPEPASPRNIAMGLGWITRDGKTIWLSDLSGEIVDVQLTDLVESPERVRFSVAYTINSGATMMVNEKYCITGSGVEITSSPPASAVQTLVQIPLLKTNGGTASQIHAEERSFTVKCAAHSLRVECLSPGSAEQYLEPFDAPNRNGIYRIGCFRTDQRLISWRVELT